MMGRAPSMRMTYTGSYILLYSLSKNCQKIDTKNIENIVSETNLLILIFGSIEESTVHQYVFGFAEDF